MAKIYHYTTIDTLALIMQNKTIRFNRLDNVDDEEEFIYGSGKENLKLGKYVFVSCWTRDSRENTDLWLRYTKNKGVRIALDEDMFKTYSVNGFKAYFPHFFKMIDDCVLPFVLNEVKLYDIQYVTDNQKRINEFIKIEDEYVNIMIQDVGLYKNEKWSVQKESRFKLVLLPVSPNSIKNIKTDTNLNIMMGAINAIWPSFLEEHIINPTSIYIPLKEEVLNSMEVMMGPETTKDDKSKVRRILYSCLLGKYFSKRKIVDSNLSVKK